MNLFAECAAQAGVPFCLAGESLLFAWKTGNLANGNIDYVGVWQRDLLAEGDFIRELEKAFSIEQNLPDRLVIRRNDSAIEIQAMTARNKLCAVDNLRFPLPDFKNLEEVNCDENSYPVPRNADRIIALTFGPSYIERTKRVVRDIFAKHKGWKTKLHAFLELLCVPVPNAVKNYWYCKKCNRAYSGKHYYRDRVSLEDFLSLKFDPVRFNQLFRSKHLEIVTGNFRHERIGDIINYLSNPSVMSDVSIKIKETALDNPVDEPIYYSKKFWCGGNNYFIYPMLFGFRKHVVPYEKANIYINKRMSPRLYSKEYYLSLEEMSDREIEEQTCKNPLEISEAGLISGRHRTAAMMGRLIRGEKIHSHVR